MRKISIYGTGTSGHQAVINTIIRFTEKAHIVCSIESITDVNVFLDKQLESVPAVQIDDGQIRSLQTTNAFNKSLRQVVQEILRKENYGDMEKVLVPVDFSETSINAFYYGHRIASDMHAVIRMLHVHQTPKHNHSVDQKRVATYQKQLENKNRLNKLATEANMDWGSELLTAAIVDQEFREGDPSHEIVLSAREKGASLIILGARGVGANGYQLYGSVSQYIMSKATVPVMVVPQDACYRGVQKIVYLHETHLINEVSMLSLTTFAKHFNSELHIIYAHHSANEEAEEEVRDILKEQYRESSITHITLDQSDDIVGLYEYVHSVKADIVSLIPTKNGILSKVIHTGLSERKDITATTPLLLLNND